MTKWAFVENNTIEGVYDQLPTSWRNISGFKFLENDIEKLKTLGWYQIKTYNDYDSNLYNEVGYTFNILDDEVIGNPILKEKTQESIPDINVENDILSNIRNERDRLLKQSDVYQLSDWQKTFSEDLKLKWLLYRVKLRDIPQIYVDTKQLEWPSELALLILESNNSMNTYISNLSISEETVLEAEIPA